MTPGAHCHILRAVPEQFFVRPIDVGFRVDVQHAADVTRDSTGSDLEFVASACVCVCTSMIVCGRV